MSLSPYRPTGMAYRLTKPSEQWKLGLQEIKILLLKRRYKQCAALSHDLMRDLDDNLHAIHKAYLQYYSAASYETLGRTAHNYSSNKLPLLNLARDGYVACKFSLADALKDFEELNENGHLDVEHDFCKEEKEEAEEKLEEEGYKEPGQESIFEYGPRATTGRVYSVFNLTEPWRTYARHKRQTAGENNNGSGNATGKDESDVDLKAPDCDDIEAVEVNAESGSELMPPPLRIQKTRKKRPVPSHISTADRSLIPPPLFSPPPFIPRETSRYQHFQPERSYFADY
ncbi:predicted protein [Uncinocarpus reesii 1704]|uniref:Uncharacterized protein n=1 Tax=Uncinocarpus reesii (strain UAMH 1704) TaxID=336963 RepID=C4JJM2_UNCRE|nr:uncharacterized protein UREG_01829 [Uncinocarpus reesii 1704]EEP76980.1 predicted protein [Uncinocarpus reesii 1704]